MTTINERLDEMRARADAATEGPWEATFGPAEQAKVWSGDDSDPLVSIEGFDRLVDGGPDATFIAAARTDLPRAVDALRAALDLLDERDEETADVYGKSEVGTQSLVTTTEVRCAIADALGVQP